MKPTILITFLFLALIPFRGTGQVDLYPPLNLAAITVESAYYVSWDQPQLPGGGFPSGLTGYRVYMDGSLVDSIGDPDTLSYYVFETGPCSMLDHVFWATAWYDLTSYGYPGQFGESPPSNSDTASLWFDGPWPLFEYWDQGNFTYMNWTFLPDQGNWAISTQSGNPSPSAIFTGLPELQNYDIQLRSTSLYGTRLATDCMDLWLEFDLKLENITGTGSEEFIAKFNTCDSTYTAFTVDNSQGFDWMRIKTNINAARGSVIRVEFHATGQNSTNIQQWLLDNILVYSICRPPQDPGLIVNNNTVHLYWNPPVCDNGTNPILFMIGYNVYRTDSSGLPPFYKLNGTPVADTDYMDVLPAEWLPGTFSYCVRATYNDTIYNLLQCETDCADTLMTVVTGTGSVSPPVVPIFPNPNDGHFRVEMEQEIIALTISDLNGKAVWAIKPDAQKGSSINVDLSGLAKGVYILMAEGKGSISRSKIIVY